MPTPPQQAQSSPGQSSSSQPNSPQQEQDSTQQSGLPQAPRSSDPQQDFSERVRESIAKYTGARHEIENAEVEEQKPVERKTPPRAEDGKFAATKPASEPEKPTEQEQESPDVQYSVDAIRKWAHENPEEAAKVAGEVFKADDQEWIKLQNRSRKSKQALAAEKKALLAAQKEFEESSASFVPILDMLEAGQGETPDFSSVDAAFEQVTGRSMDDYIRARARRGIATDPAAAALRAENARLKKQLESGAKPAEETEGEASPAAEFVLPDIDDEHPIRKLAGWEGILRKAAAPHYDPDTDEFDVDADSLATEVLQKELDKLRPPPPPVAEEKPKPKPVAKAKGKAPPRKPAPVEEDDEPSLSTERKPDEVYLRAERPADMDPMHWAVMRAQLRAQGKLK